ncbi:MAG TPA: S9 family peptidase [Paludibaculum sp.]|jgi:dipeptidyl aminopeptidase/acylaminoacyl peptidase
MRSWLLLILPALAFAQTERVTSNLGKTTVYAGLALSPDGKNVAWTQAVASESQPQLWVGPVGGTVSFLPMDGPHTESDPVWSPDSKTLAFFSTAGETEQAQLWIISEGPAPRKLTRLRGYAGRPRWSPDGKKIAFLYIEGAGGGGPLLAAPVQTGVIDQEIHNQRIAVVDVGSGQLSMASPAGLHIYDFDWSPDAAAFVTTGAPGPGDNNWWIAQLYVIRDGVARSIYKTPWQLAVPRWSPDGTKIAFVEGLMSDEGFHGGDGLVIGAAGGAAENITAKRSTSPNAIFWLGNDRLLVTEAKKGGSAVAEISLATRAATTWWEGPEDVHAFGNFPNFAVSRDGRLSAVVRSSFRNPPEVAIGPIGQWRAVTKNNAAVRPAWGEARSVEWNNEGLQLQGWLLAPAKVEPGKKYAMITVIHGGPSSSQKSDWPVGFALPGVLASQGYYVFLPNPRGSYGQGEAFTRANIRDFGGGDLRDILAGVDAAIARFPIDPKRLGVTGWSYGGYMTMWTVTQTGRFQAAMAGAGIANWQSYYGQNLIDQWMIPFFGASVYDDPAVYAKSSPIQFIKNVKTPTLIIVGERDAECPAPQSYEFWHALRTLGVPTEMVVYGGEGHMFVQTKNQVDFQDRTVAWFGKYLK